MRSSVAVHKMPDLDSIDGWLIADHVAALRDRVAWLERQHAERGHLHWRQAEVSALKLALRLISERWPDAIEQSEPVLARKREEAKR